MRGMGREQACAVPGSREKILQEGADCLLPAAFVSLHSLFVLGGMTESRRIYSTRRWTVWGVGVVELADGRWGGRSDGCGRRSGTASKGRPGPRPAGGLVPPCPRQRAGTTNKVLSRAQRPGAQGGPRAALPSAALPQLQF